jgi:hypothetical protein
MTRAARDLPAEASVVKASFSNLTTVRALDLHLEVMAPPSVHVRLVPATDCMMFPHGDFYCGVSVHLASLYRIGTGLLSVSDASPTSPFLAEHNEVTGYSLFTIAQYKTMANGGDAGPGLAWFY